MSDAARLRVWDAAVRVLHWTLASAVATAWISGHWPPRHFDAWHHTAGYVAGAAVVLRLAWGWAGSGYARLGQFLRGPRAVLAYARALRAGREPRYLGHNPLGGWMVVLLWAVAGALSLTGWLYTTDWLWGYEWLSDLHAALAWLIATLVAGHLGGVAVTGWRHRENLVASMLSGMKRAPEGDDIA
ncbi:MULTISPECIES: cytochrome b/b6 domain-containing protein [Roseateles]|uniref:Cytochrome b/b6 domain-containing protein n=1 Tax=Pelomonas caseinilytica TaxID=2906763 RepID=A0ABS8XJ28_9BURK|nr:MULTISPECIES: cytochrome b/b6 domain-containing protein [unclassified Roseateles]MCE4538574.1 cytochrome b/b6 domain-containing protein [Pelomonas sp. P7]HEV6965158.1 cytochrome b/b6 domain-containing protein [Roseateles sp.]